MLSQIGSSPLSYMAAIGINEVQWAKAFAKPRINAYQSVERLEVPNDYISLLQRHLGLVPYISPHPCWTTLAHPDLHLDNIFVDSETKKITSIIDWQSASIAEPFFHPIPRMLLLIRPQNPQYRFENVLNVSNGTGLDPLSYFEQITATENQQYWTAFNIRNRELLTEPVSLITGPWARDDVFSFRYSLLYLAARWNELAPNKPFPIAFTDDELRLHESELQLVEGVEEILNKLHNDGLIPIRGMILRENYEQAVQINKTVKQVFIDLADSGLQTALHSQI